MEKQIYHEIVWKDVHFRSWYATFKKGFLQTPFFVSLRKRLRSHQNTEVSFFLFKVGLFPNA